MTFNISPEGMDANRSLVKNAGRNIVRKLDIYIYIYIYIAKRFSNPRKESTPCDGDGKRK